MQPLKERRRYPRYQVAITSKLQLPSGELELQSSDICYQGIRLQCPKEDVLRVVPRGAQYTPDENVIVPIKLDVGLSEPFDITGKDTFCHRQSQTQFLLGFHFEGMGTLKQNTLKAYLSSLEGIASHPSMFS